MASDDLLYQKDEKPPKKRRRRASTTPVKRGGIENLGKYAGNNPGPWPGAGAPSSVVRAASRHAYDKRIKVLEEIADDKSLKPKDRTQAIRVLGQFGFGTQVNVTLENAKVFERICEVSGPFIDPENFEPWFKACLDALRDF